MKTKEWLLAVVLKVMAENRISTDPETERLIGAYRRLRRVSQGVFEGILDHDEALGLLPPSISRAQVTRLVSVGSNVLPFAAIVPTACTNSHNYPIDKVAICCAWPTLWRQTGKKGNDIGVEWRYATDDEIREAIPLWVVSQEMLYWMTDNSEPFESSVGELSIPV